MVPEPELHTDRLVLRRWRPRDLEPFAALNADPEVNEYLLGPLTRAESDALVERIEATFEARGYGLWAVERRDEPGCLGFVGLNPVPDAVPCAPAVEVGWRLARAAWGRGLATEGARAAVAFAFGPAGLDQLVSFTVPANRRSRAVMERLGLVRDPAGDFDHPSVAPGDPLRPHVLYRLDREAWEAAAAQP